MDQYKKLLDFRAPTLECPVNALAISPDGRLLAVCSDDNRVHVVSIRSNARVYKSISTHVGAMSTALWATDREGNLWLFTAGYSGVVCIYRIRLVSSHLFGDDQIVIEQDVAPVTLGDEPVEDMVLDAFSRHMAVVCPSRIYVLEVNVNDSAPLKIRDHHPDKVDPSKKNPTAYAAAFCTDEGGVPILVVSYVDSRTLRAFKVRPWSLLWERHTGFKPSTLAWVPERRYLLVYCIESLEVKVLELQDKQLILYTTLASSRPNTHKFKKIISSADHGRFALCGSDEGLLMSWDLSSGKQLSTTLDHGHGATGIGGGQPGLQAIASRTISVNSNLTNMIAGANHSEFPVVILWETVKDRPNGKYRYIGHIVFDIVCLLIAVGALYHQYLGLRTPSLSNFKGVSDLVRSATRWTTRTVGGN